jgi:hypothetical protein
MKGAPSPDMSPAPRAGKKILHTGQGGHSGRIATVGFDIIWDAQPSSNRAGRSPAEPVIKLDIGWNDGRVLRRWIAIRFHHKAECNGAELAIVGP